jgi:hypothetical protein
MNCQGNLPKGRSVLSQKSVQRHKWEFSIVKHFLEHVVVSQMFFWDRTLILVLMGWIRNSCHSRHEYRGRHLSIFILGLITGLFLPFYLFSHYIFPHSFSIERCYLISLSYYYYFIIYYWHIKLYTYSILSGVSICVYICVMFKQGKHIYLFRH